MKPLRADIAEKLKAGKLTMTKYGKLSKIDETKPAVVSQVTSAMLDALKYGLSIDGFDKLHGTLSDLPPVEPVPKRAIDVEEAQQRALAQMREWEAEVERERRERLMRGSWERPPDIVFPQPQYGNRPAPEVITKQAPDGSWTCTCEEFARNTLPNGASYCYHTVTAKDGLATQLGGKPATTSQPVETKRKRRFDFD